MTWTQIFESWFGASFVMLRSREGGFEVKRVWFRNGMYWIKGSKWLYPIKKNNMVATIYELTHTAGPSHGDLVGDHAMWTPLTKKVAAFYVMLPDKQD